MEQQKKPQWSLGAILANAEREQLIEASNPIPLEPWTGTLQDLCVSVARKIIALDKMMSEVPIGEVEQLTKAYGFDLKLQDAIEALELYGPSISALASTEEFTPGEKVFRLKMQNSELGSANFIIIPSVIQVIVHLREGKFAGFKSEPDEFGFINLSPIRDNKEVTTYASMARNQFIFEDLFMVRLDSVAKSVEDLTMKMVLDFRNKFLTLPSDCNEGTKKPS